MVGETKQGKGQAIKGALKRERTIFVDILPSNINSSGLKVGRVGDVYIPMRFDTRS